MPVLDITSQTRSALRAAAHPLKPVVLLGDKGLSASVLQEIDRNLSAHGLIKVRAGGEDRAAREDILHQICDSVSCAPVHHLGKILILYRPTEADPEGKALLAKKAGFDVSTLGLNTHRKASEPHVPKRQAQAGKPAPERKRGEKIERATGPITARERYLGASEKKTRPSLHDDAGSARGAARKSAPRRTDGGLTSTLGAARKSAAPGGRSFTKPGTARSAMSLRAGARSGAARKPRGDK